MLRKIIKIDEDKCNGCGACAAACHEGAIEMIDGKARLTREDYCDGLGDCLPACPTGAITFEMREAPAYDEAAVLAAKREKEAKTPESCSCEESGRNGGESCLSNFPVQLRLAPVNSPCFDGADLLIAADCAAYAYGSFHQDFHCILVHRPVGTEATEYQAVGTEFPGHPYVIYHFENFLL